MKVIFLDRDETLNHDPGYLNDPNQLILKKNVIAGLTILKLAGFELIVITNQSGIARGLISQKQLNAVHEKLQSILGKYDIRILKIYYCPDEDDSSKCRKPNPGMIQMAMKDFEIDMDNSYIIGDRIKDIKTGEPFKLPGILLDKYRRSEATEQTPGNLVYYAEDLLEAAYYILDTSHQTFLESKIYDSVQEKFLKEIEILKQKKKRIVLTNGCFDLLHSGHTQYLFQASLLGDILIVGLNSDRSIRSIKGELRPVLDEHTRASLLASLGFVSMVVIFDQDTPINLIKKIKPHIHVKGGDYTKEELIEYSLLKEIKAETVILPFKKGFSSSDIIRKIGQGSKKIPMETNDPSTA